MGSRVVSVVLQACLGLAAIAPACTSPPGVRSATPTDTQPTGVAESIAYHLTPRVDGEGVVALEVELRLVSDASGLTTLQLPNQWAGAEDLWRHVDALIIEGADAVEAPGESTRVIHSSPGATLSIRYRVRSAYDHDPRADEGQPFAPIVRPTWFHAFGHALFAFVPDRIDAPATFVWHGEARGFASDLEHLAAHGRTVADVLDAVVLGGSALRLHRTQVGDAEIRVAIVGEHRFADDELVSLADRVITAERDFWNDHGDPFLVTVAPLQPVAGHRMLGGTGLGDAFTVMMASDTPLEPLRHLFAHEYFHTWNSDRLGGRPPGDGLAGMWFSEGFTEYYTWRLLLRAGIYDLSDFVDDWNAALVEYAASPARTATNERIVEAFWSDPDIAMIPYRRGALLAARWAARLRDATAGQRSLDDVLHHMQRAVVDGSVAPEGPHAADLFAAAFAEVGGSTLAPGLAADLAAHVDRGEPIVLDERTFGECIRVVTTDRVDPRTGTTVVAQQLELVDVASAAEHEACARLGSPSARPVASSATE